MSRTARTLAACFFLAALLGGGTAHASVKIASAARYPSLKVTAFGYAEISWTTPTGARAHAVVAPTGALRYGARVTRANVATRTTAVRFPGGLRSLVWRTPSGTFWALQLWRRLKDHPVELRFSRWNGKPTRLTIRAVCCKWSSETVKGYASFHGKPIYGYSNTSTGVPLDEYGRNVYLDTLRYGSWRRMMGVLTHRYDGSYALWIRRYWRGSYYRGTIAGPNWGWTLAPDTRAVTASAR